jgi:fatty acid amide hydrolase 2
MPQTSGLVALADNTATSDASIVARMRAAGLIPLCVTNTSEMCMWMESNNKLYGRSCNPYDLTRTVGGSSGGEAALIAAGGVPIGLGSDVGGSIRFPSFFNGIWGHKPSGGTVPNSGAIPAAMQQIQRFCQPGPLCRHAEDLFPLLKVLAGPDGQDSECTAFALRDPTALSPRQLRVLVLDVPASFGSNILLAPLHPELAAAQARAAEQLRDLGCTVESVVIPEFKSAFPIWSAMMSAGGNLPFRQLLRRSWGGVLAHLTSVIWGADSPHTLPALILALIEVFGEWCATCHNLTTTIHNHTTVLLCFLWCDLFRNLCFHSHSTIVIVVGQVSLYTRSSSSRRVSLEEEVRRNVG